MNYAEIKYFDIADGPGVRVSLFVSGCTHHCHGCFNPETWDFDYGRPFDTDAENAVMEGLAHEYITGLTLLGGEPFEPPNSPVLAAFLKKVRERFPEKTVWCYSGYRLDDEILTGGTGDADGARALLEEVDVLVDGEFVEDLKVVDLKFRGSTNQRIIDVPASLAAGTIVEWQDPADTIVREADARIRKAEERKYAESHRKDKETR